jgi:hypothetical protein
MMRHLNAYVVMNCTREYILNGCKDGCICYDIAYISAIWSTYKDNDACTSILSISWAIQGQCTHTFISDQVDTMSDTDAIL